MFKILEKLYLFNSISSDEIKILFDSVKYSVKNYPKNYLIANRGDNYDRLMILIKGTVRGEMIFTNGKVITIENLNAPGLLAPAFLFGKNHYLPVSAIADSDVEILIISKNSLMTLFNKDNRILENYLNEVSSKTQFLSHKIFFLQFNTIEEKLATFILQLEEIEKNTVFMPYSHQELADLFGITRPSMSRVFSNLTKNKIIEQQKDHKLKILDIEYLLNISNLSEE